MSKPWVCVGHSHTNALALAGDPEVDIVDLRVGNDVWIEGQTPWRLRADLSDRVAKGQGVFLLVGGGQSVMLSQLEYRRRFDLVLPSRPDLPLDVTREIVPAEAIIPYLHLDMSIFTIAAKWVRYKLWRLHCELIEAACLSHGVAAQWPPRGALDSDGFLQPDFQLDTVHGNGAYGRLALDDLRAAGLMAPAT